jgi:Uncharacterised nucleotidyltransferase
MEIRNELLFLFKTINNKVLINKNAISTEFTLNIDHKILRNISSNGLNEFVYSYYNDLKIPIPPYYHEELLQSKLYSLLYYNEFKRVVNILTKNNIIFLPCKGFLYSKVLYKSTSFREFGDIDIIIKDIDSKKALELLLEDGYNFVRTDNLNNNLPKAIIDEAMNASGLNELSLAKKINSNLIVIDFHWSFFKKFYPYQVNYNLFFDKVGYLDFDGTICPIPNVTQLFISLIIHHGGTDFWIKLRHLADLLAFMENFKLQIDWSDIIRQIQMMKLQKTMLIGFQLLKKYFEYKLPIEIELLLQKNTISQKLLNRITDFWLNNYNIKKPYGRLKYEIILINAQDNNFNTLKYYQKLITIYSIPNPIESKRIITFNDKFVLLNILLKIISYFFKKT